MKHGRAHPFSWLTAMVCGAAGCVGPFGPDDSSSSWMVASVVEADSTTRYEGRGWYDDVRGFTIASRELADSQEERVVFYHREYARAPSGIYAFGPWDGDREGFTGVYLRRGPGPYERASFAITEGSLHITESTPTRIEGSFEFTAELYCSNPREMPFTPCEPSRLIQGGPSVKLEGSFSVGRPGPVIDEDR